jgi:hypothetical protein
MELRTVNDSATYALWSGIVTWVFNGLGCCISFIPVINLLAIPLGLVILATSVAAIAFGLKGRRIAAHSGVGGTEATAGLAMGLANIVMTLAALVFLFLAGGLALLTSAMSSAQ